jgi:hypothetical protein
MRLDDSVKVDGFWYEADAALARWRSVRSEVQVHRAVSRDYCEFEYKGQRLCSLAA